MNWKCYGRKRSWPDSVYFPGIYLEGLKKENISQDGLSSGPDLNRGSSEYGTEVKKMLQQCRHSSTLCFIPRVVYRRFLHRIVIVAKLCICFAGRITGVDRKVYCANVGFSTWLLLQVSLAVSVNYRFTVFGLDNFTL